MFYYICSVGLLQLIETYISRQLKKMILIFIIAKKLSTSEVRNTSIIRTYIKT